MLRYAEVIRKSIGYYDAVSIHPYSRGETSSDLFTRNYTDVRRVLDEIGHEDMEILVEAWGTQWQYEDGRTRIAEQARIIRDGIGIMIENGVRKITIYKGMDCPPDQTWGGQYGLISLEGEFYPAWHMLKWWSTLGEGMARAVSFEKSNETQTLFFKRTIPSYSGAAQITENTYRLLNFQEEKSTLELWINFSDKSKEGARVNIESTSISIDPASGNMETVIESKVTSTTITDGNMHWSGEVSNHTTLEIEIKE